MTLFETSTYKGAEYVKFLNLAAFGNKVAVSPSDSVIIGLLKYIWPKLILYIVCKGGEKLVSRTKNKTIKILWFLIDFIGWKLGRWKEIKIWFLNIS